MTRLGRVTTPEAQPQVKRRKDASMDLLNDLLRNPIDPEYRLVAERPVRPPRAPRWAVLLVALLIGTMFTVSAVQTTRRAPSVQTERDQLIAQIREQEKRQDELRDRIVELRLENDTHREALLRDNEGSAAIQAEIDSLAPGTGDVAVKGPGIIIVVDDAPTDREDKLNRVLDRDLQMLANGLWAAGAEAVAINGHRLSALTAIRSAGDAITVDYRSLTRPYRVEAIGDPRTLHARLVNTTGGQLWQGLQQNYQLRFDVSQAQELELAADAGLGLTHARRAN